MLALRTQNRASHVGRVAMSICFTALAAVSTATYAQPTSSPDMPGAVGQYGGSAQALGLRVGHHGSYRSATVFWQSPVWWSHNFSNGAGRLDLLGEVTATYWDARHGDPSSMWQAGTAALLRWWPSETPVFLEAGFGPTLISKTRFAGYGLSTALQFGSHVGVGYVFNKRHQVSLRGSHFSNARIKRPNNGLNVVQVDYAFRF